MAGVVKRQATALLSRWLKPAKSSRASSSSVTMEPSCPSRVWLNSAVVEALGPYGSRIHCHRLQPQIGSRTKVVACGWTTTYAAVHEGAGLEYVLDAENRASGVWADTTYRTEKNGAMLARRGLVSHIHCKKPPGRPMPERTRRANARKSVGRSKVERVAHQKGLVRMVVRTIGIARAKVKIGLVNLAYNIRRLVWFNERTVST